MKRKILLSPTSVTSLTGKFLVEIDVLKHHPEVGRRVQRGVLSGTEPLVIAMNSKATALALIQETGKPTWMKGILSEIEPLARAANCKDTILSSI